MAGAAALLLAGCDNDDDVGQAPVSTAPAMVRFIHASADAPNVPAISEFIPGFDFAPVIGVFAKAGTPKSPPSATVADTRRRSVDIVGYSA